MKRTVATFLVSYDAEYLKISLPKVYPHVDRITLALDRERLTWTGNRYELPDCFFGWVEDIDVDRKISIYEDTFYFPGKGPLELDSRQRQMAAEFAGMEDTWHIQVDADEYVLNFPALLKVLRNDEQKQCDCEGVLYWGKLITLFKQDDNGFFYVDNGQEHEKVALAASRPKYVAARKIVCREEVITDVYVVHQTFARDYDALRRKFESWGHSNDFDTNSYLKLWEAVDRHNYFYLSNFQPNYHKAWRRLQYLEARDAQEFVGKYSDVISARSLDASKRDKEKENAFSDLLRRLVGRACRSLRL